MKLKILMCLLVTSFQISFADIQTCEEISYNFTTYDFDLSLNDCDSLIREAKKKKGCTKEVVDEYISNLKKVEINNFGSKSCIYNGEKGAYQIMTSTMAEPPVAVFMFSKWD